jgi:hypothetical protein
MSDKQDKIDFIVPSTIENIDEAIFNWLDKEVNLFTDTNEGWRKVPVIWGNAERSFMIKNNPDRNDLEGAIILPIITVQRTSMQKNLANRSVFGAHARIYECRRKERDRPNKLSSCWKI